MGTRHGQQQLYLSQVHGVRHRRCHASALMVRLSRRRSAWGRCLMTNTSQLVVALFMLYGGHPLFELHCSAAIDALHVVYLT